MIQKAAESSQTSAAKQASTRRNGTAAWGRISASLSGVGAGSRVMQIPARHNKLAADACTSGEAVKSGGRLQTR